jgi:hypothetical protein
MAAGDDGIVMSAVALESWSAAHPSRFRVVQGRTTRTGILMETRPQNIAKPALCCCCGCACGQRAAPRRRHVAGTAWSSKRYLNIGLVKNQQMREAITVGAVTGAAQPKPKCENSGHYPGPGSYTEEIVPWVTRRDGEQAHNETSTWSRCSPAITQAVIPI